MPLGRITSVVALSLLAAGIWLYRPRRRREPGFKFVYVNQDRSVRELSPGEQEYVSTEFHFGDGARPGIKRLYKGRDLFGSQSGFIERRYVPARIVIAPVHPDFDARDKELGLDLLGSYRAAGYIIETRSDGSVCCIPNPKISRVERMRLLRRWQLQHQRRREELARYDS